MAGTSLMAFSPMVIVRCTIGVRRTIAVRCTRGNRITGAAGRTGAFVGDDQEDEELFLPLRLFYAGRSFSPRDRREWHRERMIAERVNRHREQWEGRGGSPGRSPGRMRGLSRADIVDVAVAIADAEGTDAVSMRRIARDLRVGA